MPTYETRAELDEAKDERLVSTLTQMMESQAYRELAAAQMFGHGLQFVPAIKYQRFMVWHIREEFEHYEDVAKMYRTFTGQSVEPIVNARLAKKPIAFAQSWFELAMAQFLYDRGGFWQLKEYESCSYVPYRKVIEKIILEERGHQALGERIVVELVKTGQYEGQKQENFVTWLRQGLLSFGRPDTEGSRYAIEAGIKKRNVADVMQDFVDDIKPAVKACGLVFPTAAQMGLELPATLNFSLESVDESKAQGYKTGEADELHLPS